jgi:probable addiction module antidote protein
MKVKPFDPAAYLQTDEEIAEYLNQAYDGEDPEVFVIALGKVIRAQGGRLTSRWRSPAPCRPCG